MNQQNAESKLEQAAKAYATENMRHVDNDELDQFAIMWDSFTDGVKSEAAKEYWQSLTTPASDDYPGIECGLSVDEWELERVVDKIRELPTLEAIGYLRRFASTPSKPHTVEEGQTQKPAPIKTEGEDDPVKYVAVSPNDTELIQGWYKDAKGNNFQLIKFAPAPPSPVGIELLDKLDNYIRQELMYQTEAGHQPREGLNKAYFNVIDAIETYKESSASLPQSSTEEESQSGEGDAVGDFLQELQFQPYPEDIFPPISKEDLAKIHLLLKKEMKMPLDRLTGHIGRELRKPIIESAIKVSNLYKQSNK